MFYYIYERRIQIPVFLFLFKCNNFIYFFIFLGDINEIIKTMSQRLLDIEKHINELNAHKQMEMVINLFQYKN